MLRLIFGLIYTMAFPLIADAASRHRYANVGIIGGIVLCILPVIIKVGILVYKAKCNSDKEADATLNEAINAVKGLWDSRHSEKDK